jgi:class 3 adenylate cyclase
MTETRRLAAIMAVDVVDYSRLMGEDESGSAAGWRAAQCPICHTLALA